ncbi:cation:proton antiporter [Candidatus Woesearchaeota archaeon]|nr:cation:proton antiporter [Candidatus Woesearchaeota archaeon]
MPAEIGILTSIAIVLLTGLLVSVIAAKLRVPDVLLLILAGAGLGQLSYQDAAIIQFPDLFLSAVSLLALALIVFDGSSKIRLRELDTFSVRAMKLALAVTVLLLGLFAVFSHYYAGLTWTLSFLLATLVAGTSPEVLLPLVGALKHRVVEILKLESLFNTPLTVLLPFLVLQFSRQGIEVIAQVTPFLLTFVAGLGAGVFVGIILFKALQSTESNSTAALSILAAAILSYVLAENLGGNGVLAVTTLGLFMGNLGLRRHIGAVGFESLLARALYLFVFVLLGVVLQLKQTSSFFLMSGVLFLAYTAIRLLAVSAAFPANRMTFGERIYASLNAPKGIATAAVVFTLAVGNVPGSPLYVEGMSAVLDITIAFIIYSLILSSIVSVAGKRLLQ